MHSKKFCDPTDLGLVVYQDHESDCSKISICIDSRLMKTLTN